MKLTTRQLKEMIEKELAETWHDRSEVPAEEAGMAQHLNTQPDRHMAKALEIAPQVATLMVGGLGPWAGKSPGEVYEIVAKHLVAAYKEAAGESDRGELEQADPMTRHRP